MKEKTYSTVQISKLLGITRQTVSHWVDQGKLKGYKTPGGHRKILQHELVAFCRSFGMPLPREITESAAAVQNRTILVVHSDASMLARMEVEAPSVLGEEIQLKTFTNAYEALLALHDHQSCLLCIPRNLQDIHVMQAVEAVKSRFDEAQVRVAYLADDGEIQASLNNMRAFL